MRKFYFVLLLVFTSLFSKDFCRTDMLAVEPNISSKEVKEEFLKYDFSSIYTQTSNDFIFGVMGNEMQRFKIKILAVSKDKDNASEYFVVGKTLRDDGKIREFSGVIIIDAMREIMFPFIKEESLKNEDIQEAEQIDRAGILSAKYFFKEYGNSQTTGSFFGVLHSKWFLSKDGNMKYNDIRVDADGYFNNSFVGRFEEHSSKKRVGANWGDYRVPYVPCDFDIGEEHFLPSEKYIKNGWENYVNAKNGDKKAQEIESSSWWK
ncbi:MAG: hypothetical protein ACK5LP_04915 [Campylobacteraceae bacterium]